MVTPDNIGRLIAEHKRRLQLLNERGAREGHSVAPEVLIEIEDIEAEIQRLQNIVYINNEFPSAPAIFVGRAKDLNNLKVRLGIASSQQKQLLTIIRGWPGVGKTALVS